MHCDFDSDPVTFRIACKSCAHIRLPSPSSGSHHIASHDMQVTPHCTRSHHMTYHPTPHTISSQIMSDHTARHHHQVTPKSGQVRPNCITATMHHINNHHQIPMHASLARSLTSSHHHHQIASHRINIRSHHHISASDIAPEQKSTHSRPQHIYSQTLKTRTKGKQRRCIH